MCSSLSWIIAVVCFVVPSSPHLYDENSNNWLREAESALRNYRPCQFNNCSCYESQVKSDLARFKNGISEELIQRAASLGVYYQVIGGRVFRQKECLFSSRCEGVEHYLLQFAAQLPDLEFVLNVFDHPKVPTDGEALPVFSFSKDKSHADILYPTWSFWSGGPAISLYPAGIGKWDETKAFIKKYADDVSWEQRESKGFFRGSRTNAARDAIVLMSRRLPDLVDAQYTKNQAWRSVKDTLGAEPAKEVPFEKHCHYKYLFNFAGVAASFRLRHLLICGSTVFHVGNDWTEFFYGELYPWVHYVPVPEHMNNIEELLNFARHHDDMMRGIGRRGREFIEKHLSTADVLCYWRLLLTEYSKLLTYKARRDSSFIRIL